MFCNWVVDSSLLRPLALLRIAMLLAMTGRQPANLKNVKYNTVVSKHADTIGYLFDNKSNLLAKELLEWIEGSPRFAAFAETYRDKIRKKIRVAHDPERLLDLRGELEVAYRLFGDRRLGVEYEPYASFGGRGADFVVSYRTNLKFNIEIARMRAGEMEFADTKRNEERILRIVLEKLGQMQTNMPNLLAIHVNEKVAKEIDLGKLMQRIKDKAERGDETFYSHIRYSKPAEFYKHFLRLTGVLFWGPNSQLWINKQAKVGLDEKVLRLVSLIARKV
jgi:hypothetical protein